MDERGPTGQIIRYVEISFETPTVVDKLLTEATPSVVNDQKLLILPKLKEVNQ